MLLNCSKYEMKLFTEKSPKDAIEIIDMEIKKGRKLIIINLVISSSFFKMRTNDINKNEVFMGRKIIGSFIIRELDEIIEIMQILTEQ